MIQMQKRENLNKLYEEIKYKITAIQGLRNQKEDIETLDIRYDYNNASVDFLEKGNAKYNICWGNGFGINNACTEHLIPLQNIIDFKEELEDIIEHYFDLLEDVYLKDLEELNVIYEIRKEECDNYIKNLKEKLDKETKKNIQPKNGYVYIIEVNGYYKIGQTSNPKKRFGEYTKLMEKPKTICCEYVAYYKNVEKELHEIFKTKNTNGEWFDLSKDELILAVDYINARKINPPIKSA